MKLSKLNLYKRMSVIESQLDYFVNRLENCHKLIFAIATIMNINPKLLTEYAKDEEKLTKYVLGMVKNDQKNNKKN